MLLQVQQVEIPLCWIQEFDWFCREKWIWKRNKVKSTLKSQNDVGPYTEFIHLTQTMQNLLGKTQTKTGKTSCHQIRNFPELQTNGASKLDIN